MAGPSGSDAPSAALLRVPRFCLGCMGEQEYEIVRATDSEGREHTYSGTWPIAPDALHALIDVARAAVQVRALEDAGRNDWWKANAALYLALEKFDASCAESVARGD